MKYQTMIAAGGLPPCQAKWLAGNAPCRKARPPKRVTSTVSSSAKPAYMSTNCTWSVSTTVRMPPRWM